MKDTWAHRLLRPLPPCDARRPSQNASAKLWTSRLQNQRLNKALLSLTPPRLDSANSNTTCGHTAHAKMPFLFTAELYSVFYTCDTSLIHSCTSSRLSQTMLCPRCTRTCSSEFPRALLWGMHPEWKYASYTPQRRGSRFAVSMPALLTAEGFLNPSVLRAKGTCEHRKQNKRGSGPTRGASSGGNSFFPSIYPSYQDPRQA